MRGLLKCLISLRCNIRHDRENVALEQISHSDRCEIDVAALFSALPHENLPFSASSSYFLTTLLVSFLQDLDLARLLWNGR